jgi:hypothetical protein
MVNRKFFPLNDMCKIIYTTLLIFMGLAGCQQKIEQGDFDVTQWKADPLACKSVRRTLVPQLENLKPRLYGHTPREVMAILGKPDAEELREGAQRVFLYYLEPGVQCEKKETLSQASKVLIRFNALNQVSEVAYSKPVGEFLRP